MINNYGSRFYEIKINELLCYEGTQAELMELEVSNTR